MTEPRADHPVVPGYGIPESTEGILPWSWAIERLERAMVHWLATTGNPRGVRREVVIVKGTAAELVAPASPPTAGRRSSHPVITRLLQSESQPERPNPTSR